MKITYAEEKDIAAIAAAEAACFPPAEAATEQEFVERIKYYSNHFWLLYDADKLIACVLRKIRLCRRRRVREIHARKCPVASDAADVLRS